MVKKIKFPLEMANGIMVRTLDELKENFNLEKVVLHYKTGKLLIWLQDRYYGNEADKVEKLTVDDINVAETLCTIFGIIFCEEIAVDIEAIEERNIRLNKLKQYTNDEDIIKNIDKVAFDQEELINLVGVGEKKIYLCEEIFKLTLPIVDVELIGINNPTIVIESQKHVNLDKMNIIINNCILKSDDNIKVQAEKSRNILCNGRINLQKYNYEVSKIYIKERYIYKEELELEVQQRWGVWRVDKNGRRYHKIKSLYRSNQEGNNEELIVDDYEDINEFCSNEDTIFYTTGRGGILGNYKVNRVDLDGRNKIELGIECYNTGGLMLSECNKALLCNKDYLIWVEKGKYYTNIYRANHDGNERVKLLGLNNNVVIHMKIEGQYLFYYHEKNANLYRMDLETKTNILIDSEVVNIEIDRGNIYYLKNERTGWGMYKNEGQKCFYKVDINGQNKVLLEHKSIYGDFIVRMNYFNGILYYYTRKKLGGSFTDPDAPEIENKIVIDK